MALNKRILRDLKDNFFRYFALFLIASVGIMLVISLSAAADTVIKTTKDNAVHNFAEDGQFSVFIPLSDEVVCELDEKGVTIEQNFYLDFFIGEDSTLRVFRSRKNINLPAVDEGRLPETENEIFLEKIYAQKHKLTLGNELTIAGMNFTVSGIGSVPDYECIKKNLSDVGTDAYNFSVALLTDRAYDMLKDTGLSKETELYLYSFLINGSMTADQLKEYLLDIDFDEARITDPYLREMLNEMNEEKNKINDGIAELADGSARFSDGLSVLDGNSAALNEAAGSILDTLLLSAA